MGGLVTRCPLDREEEAEQETERGEPFSLHCASWFPSFIIRAALTSASSALVSPSENRHAALKNLLDEP